jgi:HK97 family phage portal protein
VSLWRSEKRELPASTPLRSWSAGNGSVWETNDSALRLVPVYAAVSLIADSISIMPVHGYYDGAGGKRQKLNPQPTLCSNPHPNPRFTRIEWIHQFCASYLLRGNAYGLVSNYDNLGRPDKVTWLHPDSVRVEAAGATTRYYINEELVRDEILHIPWFPKPGSAVGMSPIAQFRSQMETGLQAANFGRNWFANSSVPTGWLKWMTGPLQPAESASAKERFKAAVYGGDIFVSGNDWDWKQLGVAPADAQYLETIKATATEIASIYKLSPEDIGGNSGNSLTYKTLEMDQYRMQVRAFQPIFTRLEAHMTRLLPEGQYVKFNPDALIRTDIKTRFEAYQIGLTAGIYRQEDVLDLEDLPHWTKPQKAAWKEMYGSAGGTNGANPNGNPTGTQVPKQEGGA